MKTSAERNAELRKPIEGLLKYMAERLEDGLDFGEENPIYEHNIYLGFGNDAVQCRAKFYVCPESYEILEEACNKIIDFIDAEYPASDPIGKVVKSYEIFSTGGGFYSVLGQLVDGRWFTGETPENGCWGFGLYETKDAANESMNDDMIGSIDGNTAKYVIMWNEIIDDYAKGGESHKDEAEKWRNAIIEEYMEADE